MQTLETAKERERNKRNSDIVSDFQNLKKIYPGCSLHRLCTVLSEKYNLSGVMIKNVLKKECAI